MNFGSFSSFFMNFSNEVISVALTELLCLYVLSINL